MVGSSLSWARQWTTRFVGWWSGVLLDIGCCIRSWDGPFFYSLLGLSSTPTGDVSIVETLINFKKLINPSIPILKVLIRFFFYSVKPRRKKNSYATTLVTSIKQVVFYERIATIYIHLFTLFSINYVERVKYLLNNI